MERLKAELRKEILEILKHEAVNEENQAGIKGNVIWEDDFEIIAEKLINLFTKKHFIYLSNQLNAKNDDGVSLV